MMRSVHTLLLAIAGTITLSSCVLPLATGDQNCVSYCTLLQGCGSSSAPTSDCNAWCSAMATQLEKEGCNDQFDSATACVVGEGTCEAASCTSQVQATVDCQNQYCTAHPTESECQP